MTLIFIAAAFLSASAGFVWGWAMGARMVRANYEARDAVDDWSYEHRSTFDSDRDSAPARRERRPF